jgi:hypothetical protein
MLKMDLGILIGITTKLKEIDKEDMDLGIIKCRENIYQMVEEDMSLMVILHMVQLVELLVSQDICVRMKQG